MSFSLEWEKALEWKTFLVTATINRLSTLLNLKTVGFFSHWGCLLWLHKVAYLFGSLVLGFLSILVNVAHTANLGSFAGRARCYLLFCLLVLWVFFATVCFLWGRGRYRAVVFLTPKWLCFNLNFGRELYIYIIYICD